MRHSAAMCICQKRRNLIQQSVIFTTMFTSHNDHFHSQRLKETMAWISNYILLFYVDAMGLLPDTWNCGLRMRRECRERFPRHSGLAIPTCITARASRTCRDACRDRLLALSFEVGGGENVPGIPGACAIRNFTHLQRGPLPNTSNYRSTNRMRLLYG